MDIRPANRFIEILNILEDKTLTGKQKTDYDYYCKNNSGQLKSHFNNLYWKLIKK
ncbi:hypothetical protein ES705_45683 [subsurface metagenome]